MVTDPLLLTSVVTAPPQYWHLGSLNHLLLTFGVINPPSTDIWVTDYPPYWHLGSLTPLILTFGVTDHPSYWHLGSMTFGVTDPPSYWHMGSLTPLILTFAVTDPSSSFGVTDPIILTFRVTDPLILTLGVTDPPPTDLWGNWTQSVCLQVGVTDLSEDGRLVVALLHVDGDVHLRGLAGQPAVLGCGLRTTQREWATVV